MQLRSRKSTPSPCSHQTHKRRRSSAQKQNSESELPPEILYLLVERLTCLEDVAAASAVCKSWAKHMRAGIFSTTLHVGSTSTLDSLELRAEPVTSLARNCPSLSELQVVISGRSSYDAVQEVLSTVHILQELKTLRLNFVVSQTPKKGMWPMFFADSLSIGKIQRLVVEGSSMPPLAVLNLLSKLSGSKHLRSLQLLAGRPLPGSQLPCYKPPVWMTLPYYSNSPTAITQEQLESLCKLSSLEELTFEPGANSITSATFKGLSKLKSLTSLVLHGPQTKAVLRRMTQLRRLRKLQVEVAFDALHDHLDLASLEHVQEIELGLTAGSTPILSLPESPIQLNNQLHRLSGVLQHKLKGLSLSGFLWCKATGEHLTALSELSSLQLLDVKPPFAASSAQLDLTPLGKLQHIQKFALQLAPGTTAITALKFGVHWEQEGSRRSSSGGQSTSKRGGKKQKTPSVKDVSGIATVWPNLRSLQLSHIPPSAVKDTTWDFQQLTSLTNLCLQFTPTADAVTNAAALAAVMGFSGPDSPAFLESLTAKLRLDQLPRELQQLQLTGCSVMVPYYVPFSEHLTSLSLSHCWLNRSWKLQLQFNCSPSATPAPETPSSSGPIVTSPKTPSSNISKHLWEPLVVLLRHLPTLQQLELANMHHTQLHDGLLAAATAAAGPDAAQYGGGLRGLASLAVLGVGNPGLSHGGLLGLTNLRKLRMLRWHVGDALELMPDLGALAKLQGLVALHIPTWLHAQMERWGAYAVLDSLPFCDVHVESV